ncbi:hypothetical protein ASD15_05895 [Massilia sp. Root351]|jgi:hypothetical protein|uniref:hypothetical protein n=1 Tax=Massilia sp. Root351 TaxID=1736522 RepID=UPI000710C2BB|nr:hypothetical protein [Massilia sp. Root351]KQV84703.1 hypothetical protein ASD15_05895 [Massilia sp. Root351]
MSKPTNIATPPLFASLPGVTALALALAWSGAAAAGTETRPPSEAEIKSFESWFSQRPGAGTLRAGYDIQRGEGARDWTVTAWAEQPPQRAAWRLCLARADGYNYDARTQRWSANGERRQYVWLDRSADCGVSPQRVHLKQELGERDIVTVLEQQGAVLQSARLLFAGNTRCAPQRANKFELTAIDVTPDRFYQLTYVSDRGGNAVVTVRKRARELTAWGARC